jgi:hypothetical protein
MKNFILIIAGLIFSIYATAQTSGNKVGPVIKFDKTTHDFGEVKENTTPITYKFKFTNNGDTPLILLKVEASCKCTKPVFSQKPIPPGGSDFITVGFKTLGYGDNSFSKTISVVTNANNDAPTKLTLLTIKGKVRKKAETE